MSPQKADHSTVVLWKDHLDTRAVSSLAEEIARQFPKFKREAFVQAVLDDDLLKRELKDRINTIARHLRTFLPADYRKAVAILIKVAPRAGMWQNLALTSFVEQFGLDDFETSVQAMEALTPHSTCEFTIRPYLLKNLEYMLPVIHRWTSHPNEHVRRLAAEGTRPRGVWMQHVPAFKRNPRIVIEVLEKLKADESLYVRKAVANNLNDISKDHPALAIKTAFAWKKDRHKHTDWIIKHACRSLIKDGHPEVFPLFGFAYPPQVRVEKFSAKPKRVSIGETLAFSFSVVSESTRPQKLAIDYIIHYVRANGKTGTKVFKLAERHLPADQALTLSGTRPFVKTTTRRLYPGRHLIQIMVNGTVLAEQTFSLSE